MTGTQGATSVVRVRGVPVSSTAPQGGQVLKYNAATAQWEPSADGTGADWTLTGNVGTTPGTNFLGTTDNVALELKVNGQRALRLEPTFFSPNVVGGHSGNAVAGAVGATIAGGGAHASTNSVTDNFGTVGGGYANQAGNGGTTIDNVAATVAGGHNNTASGHRAIVGGGGYNQATELAATVAGGDENVASGQSSAVGGGHLNVASGSHATIGGGGLNKATRDNATVAGGAFNQAGGDVGGPATGSNATVGGGDHNVASGTAATVPGGAENRAQGQYSLAAGQRAKADHFGTFVWADGNGVDLVSTGSNQFIVRAAGGLWLGTTSAVPAAGMVPNGRFIDTSTGAYLSNSGVWTDVSDRDAKTDFAPVDRQALLRQVAALPVGTWRYKTDASDVRHLGPVAQDFHAAFGLGDSDKHLAALDTSGVALAAVQGLHELVQERDAEVAALREEGAVQQAQIAALEARLTALERTSVREPAASGAGWSLVGVVGLVLAGAVIGPRYRASPRQ